MTRVLRTTLASFFRTAGVCGSLLLVSAISASAAEPDFKTMMRKVIDSWQTLDPEKAAVYYDKNEHAVFFDVLPLKYTGWTAYFEGTKDAFKNWASLTIALNDDAWIERKGDMAITAVTARGEVVEKSGAKNSLDLRWTVVWEKHGDAWLIVHEHLSAPLMVPPPAAQAPTGTTAK
ncbi:MAG TPA: nuclear transport factor 2 family protein [bacterium]|nr:nuclear transport factor 2 family protein [bacterium]